MKAIILLLVFSSGLFADTIKYTANGEEKVKDNVIFNKVDNNYVYYISSTKTINKIQCNQVIEIISETGDNINFNCSELLLVKESSETKNIDDQLTKTYILIIITIVAIAIPLIYINGVNDMGMM